MRSVSPVRRVARRRDAGRSESILPAASPLDEDDLVPDLAQGARVESESTVERLVSSRPSSGQQLLVINLKTAKALGLTIPQSLLLRADRVIE